MPLGPDGHVITFVGSTSLDTYSWMHVDFRNLDRFVVSSRIERVVSLDSQSSFRCCLLSIIDSMVPRTHNQVLIAAVTAVI